ncbi:hypothetical protein CAPTEDRAFT_205933 [Capitella teleta]|uniref:G-protein coupled receptors family 1 profile domain-containing protein n=1 Tax=Capitella teleta TaxID=283909 RepID=R7U8B0_CAPTE|nr:hypothetical protein CAPTEDRAFT_205933 [Capitella teleta]|eukprot:ELU02381.1 hypothetical protein CAPTEDRAFT_205933 [Capitella teleta]
MDSTTNGDFTTTPATATLNPRPCLLYYLIIATLVGGITIVIGLLGNALSLKILGKQRKKSSTIQALCLLAVADSFVLVACLPVPVAGVLGMIYGLKGSHSVGVLASVYTFEVARIFNQVSTLLTVILMWQRYVAVCLPHKAKRLCTVRMVNIASGCSSMAACAFYLPNFFLYSLKTSSNGGLYPVSHSLVHNAYFQTFHSLVLTYLVSYIIPVTSLLYMSVGILKSLKSNSNSATAASSQNARKDLTKSSIAIVIIFIICQSLQPTKRVLMWVYDPFTRNVACGGELQYFAFMPHIALMLNSSANFSVYILFARGFRRKLMAILTNRNAVAPSDFSSSTNAGTSVGTASEVSNRSKHIGGKNEFNSAMVMTLTGPTADVAAPNSS